MRLLSKGQLFVTHNSVFHILPFKNINCFDKICSISNFHTIKSKKGLTHSSGQLSALASIPAKDSLLFHRQKRWMTGTKLPFHILQRSNILLFKHTNFPKNSLSTSSVTFQSEKSSGVKNAEESDEHATTKLGANTFGGSNETSGDKTKGQQKDSWWRGKNSWRLGLILLSGSIIAWGVGLVTSWGAPLLDPDGNEIEDEYSEEAAVSAYLKRTWKEMNIFKQKIQDPSREKLLPPPLKYPYIQPPYTLAIELTGVLIHPDWTYQTGWRFKKRPAIDYFLSQVGPPLFEVVIYSSESGMTADGLVTHLDQQGYIMYRLYRDATRYTDGHHVKDLSCLNREMSKIIMVDCNDKSVKLQPRNAFILNKWKGGDEDRKLVDLAHFLKTVAASGVDDVRQVLDYYHQFDDPLEAFKENQRKLQEEEELRSKAVAEENKKKSWFASFRKTT